MKTPQPAIVETRPETKGPTACRVRLALVNAEAQEVFVAGSFNNWHPGATPLDNLGQGHWVKDILLAPGRYEYQFVIDGRWMQDRNATELVDNPFGGVNSVLHVPPSVYTPGSINSAAKSIQPKWNWHYKTLLQLRDRLLKTRSDHIEATTEPIKPYSMSFSDSAIAESERDMKLSELRAEQDTLYEVDQAIHRILDGTYGKCDETGTRIPAARLRAVPWTRYSKDVEEKLEHQRTGRAPA